VAPTVDTENLAGHEVTFRGRQKENCPQHILLTKNEEFVKRAYDQWVEHNIDIMMILPANALCTNYAENWIEPFAEDHAINRKFCKFLYKGEKKDSSRNGYRVVIWRKIER